jgi:hypothetical protein
MKVIEKSLTYGDVILMGGEVIRARVDVECEGYG